MCRASGLTMTTRHGEPISTEEPGPTLLVASAVELASALATRRAKALSRALDLAEAPPVPTLSQQLGPRASHSVPLRPTPPDRQLFDGDTSGRDGTVRDGTGT